MKNMTKEDLRDLCQNAGYDVAEDGGAVAMYLPCGPGRTIVVYFIALEAQSALRAVGVASGLALARENLLDAYEFVNAWNANRSFPRAVVGNVEGEGPLSFGVDMAIATSEEVSAEYLRASFLDVFISAAQDFFQAAYSTFIPSQSEGNAQ